jgi:transcriptional regulator of arginine metabolism
VSPVTAARRRLLRRLLAEETVTSQRQLVHRLAEEGHAVTQATVSRDLDMIGAVKVHEPGKRARYEIPADPAVATAAERVLSQTLADFVESIDVSVNMVVLHTPPGAAHLVGGSIDRAGIDGVLGTVAGDDTLIVVAGEDVGGAALARELERIGAT